MLLKIYICTLIFAYVSAIFYVVRFVKYDLKNNPDMIHLDVISVLILVLLLLIPIINIPFGYMYLYYGVIADEEEFERLMEEQI